MIIPRFLIFNFFTKAYLKLFDAFFPLNRRLKTMATDFIFILSIYFPIFIIVMIPVMIFATNDSNQITLNIILGLIPFSVTIFTIINKDFYNGRSVAKRILGYQIIDKDTKQVATEMQCMIRNLTIIIWPIEVIIALINPKQRLGDVIAGTILVDKEKENKENIIKEIRNKRIVKNHVGLILISILFAVFFNLFAVLSTLI